ncbi:TetR/AcrR family transcriptional regulator C-terminal domain-containing protein [Nocardia sp. NPDC060256]|uniref:TetR/AcrR family transcriptional regulator C-terminal domain-containing protein n=1 Tax=unclassified Nocardia TaxID=2637762 RepID=UPI0036601D1E
MKLDTQVIAQAALDLLDDVGLEGLTMRKVAAALDVQAPALYWHVKNKRELLDAMARTVFVAAVDGVEAPRQGEAWQEWAIGLALRLRRSMLRYRDGASVLAGTYVDDEAMWRTVELSLRTLEDAGFELADAVRVFPILLHYTVGFVIEEQARGGAEYDNNPYRPDRIEKVVDTTRYPLTAKLVDTLFTADYDAEFDHGLRVILAGIGTTRTGQPR